MPHATCHMRNNMRTWKTGITATTAFLTSSKSFLLQKSSFPSIHRMSSLPGNGSFQTLSAPAASRTNQPFRMTKNFCVIIMVNPDSQCKEFIESCYQVCAKDVHNHCLQDPETWHFTVCVDNLSFEEAESLQYLPGPLPNFHITGIIDWNHVVALKSDTDMSDVVNRLQGLKVKIDVNDLNQNLHMTIYKLRGRSGPPYQAKQIEFQRIKETAEKVDLFGTAKGTKVILKEIGGCYSGSDGRFYRILYEE